MQTATEKLLPAQKEVHRTAHDQDLVEVPKRARLDREAEGRNVPQVIPVLDKQQAAFEERGMCNLSVS
ncbi:MAG: hypothetical protein ACLPY1_22390 [Terracidiphilus sp.]